MVGVKVNDNGFVRFDGVAEVLDSVEGERGFGLAGYVLG